MHDNLLLVTVATALKNRTSIRLAYSGGLDSTVLLHVLARLTKQNNTMQVRAIYIHHGLSQHADRWAAHCQQQCALLGITFKQISVSVDPSQGDIEQQARNARYHALAKQMHAGDVLITAQHQDDQCETFFLALKRGSGPSGLSAMPQEKTFASGQLIRPLLTLSRQQLEQYAQRHQLQWIEDDSNQDCRFDRNFLRHTALPVLSKRWPHFTEMVARSAKHCAAQEQLLNELLDEQLHTQLDQQGNLIFSSLLTMNEAKRNGLLRRWLAYHHQLMPSTIQLAQLWQDVVLAKKDASPSMRLNERNVHRYQQTLYLLPMMQDLAEYVIQWDMQQPLILPDQIGQLYLDTTSQKNEIALVVRIPKYNEQATIRFTAEGQYSIVGRAGSRKIKKLWQEHHIPPWLRTRTPLLYYNDQLIAALGVFTTKEGQASSDDEICRIIYQPFQKE